MASKLLRLRVNLTQKYTTSQSLIKENINNINTKLNSIEMPERFKGTVVERMLIYWKSLMTDYREVFVGVGNQIKEKPIRASIYGALAGSAVYCYKRNPSERDFINHVRLHNSNMVLVSEICQNPISSQYIIFLERCYNEGIVRRLNLGIFSLLWIDNFDKSVCLYKATCEYTKPELTTWHQRVVDVGFLNKWWKLEEKMIDYDINSDNV